MSLFGFGRLIFRDQIVADPGTSQLRIGTPADGSFVKKDLPAVSLWPSAADPSLSSSEQDTFGSNAVFDGGAIRNHDGAIAVVRSALRELTGRTILKPRCIISVPASSHATDRIALRDLFEQAGCTRILLVEAPLAAAIGAGLNVVSATPSMVGVLGAAKSEFSIMANGGSLATAGSRNGWNSLLIACASQHRIAQAQWPDSVEITRAIRMIFETDKSELPKTDSAPYEAIIAGIDSEIDRILAPLFSVLDSVPASTKAIIEDRGVTLTGGMSGNDYIVRRLSAKAGVRILSAPNPRDCVFDGLATVGEMVERDIALRVENRLPAILKPSATNPKTTDIP